jgi:hypothetical protein
MDLNLKDLDDETFVSSFLSTSFDPTVLDLASDFTDERQPFGEQDYEFVDRSPESNGMDVEPMANNYRRNNIDSQSTPSALSSTFSPHYQRNISNYYNPNSFQTILPIPLPGSQSGKHPAGSEPDMRRANKMRRLDKDPYMKEEFYQTPNNPPSGNFLNFQPNNQVQQNGQAQSYTPLSQQASQLSASQVGQTNGSQSQQQQMQQGRVNFNLVKQEPQRNSFQQSPFELQQDAGFYQQPVPYNLQSLQNNNNQQQQWNTEMSVKEESDGAFDTDESQDVDNGAPIQYTGLEHMKVKLVVDNQPPVEVRTRTPSEKRNFQCSLTVNGDWKSIGGKYIMAELIYAVDNDGEEGPKQSILGGTKTVTIRKDNRVVFDNLSMSEASTKHKEKEFCVRFSMLDKKGKKIPNIEILTNPFYAYSNTKVLARRRNIQLRALSQNTSSINGGDSMHVIGAPFIGGPALKLVIRTAHGDVPATSLELYSETVLFFKLPAYPFPVGKDEETVKVQILVTNDGRNFSNSLDFYYVTGNTQPSRRSLL